MTMHMLNCVSMKPPLLNWHVGGTCLLVEREEGWVMVDSGLGLQDHLNPSKAMRASKMQFGVIHAPQETAVRQAPRLGVAPEAVKHIVQTHLHFDHAGGLADFPWAAVHVHRREFDTLAHPQKWIERYAHNMASFAHGPQWVLYEEARDKWFDFDAIRLPFTPEMFLVPLFGHTSGLCGVAIREGEGWYFQCADALPLNANFDFQPTWLVHWILGPHVPRLKAFSQAHPEIHMLSGHMSVSLYPPIPQI